MMKILSAEKNKLLKMGNVVDYIRKPFDLDELTEIIYEQTYKLTIEAL